jgi:single-stranded-DNA-specific exonuclease
MTIQKHWNLLPFDDGKARFLRDSLKIDLTLCKILVQRGIETFEQSRQYFRPQLSELHDPWLMKDMEKAVVRVLSAIHDREKLLVFGDYDVDGTTAVACMFQFLSTIFPEEMLDFYIPNRYREGYGVSKAGIDFAKANGFSLILSLDCGIKSVELIAAAKEMGIDFIVCDHHQPDLLLPPAVAILNPKQVDCKYPFKGLCGCGVGFKLISALVHRLGLPPDQAFQWLDLVATAIAADIVPLTGENRILAFYGLKKVNEHPNPGIKAIMEFSGLQKDLTMGNLVFMIAPRINAAGRMDDARKAVQLFIAKTPEEALGFADRLHSDNSDRKEADSSITEEAIALIEADKAMVSRNSIVLFQTHWHKGVVGIVASRLIEKYYRPTIILTKSGDVVSGSARSVRGFNLYEAIHACREHLLGYGGHFAAAGLTMLPEQVGPFTSKFEEIVTATIEPHQLVPEIIIDATIKLEELTNSLYKIICQMEPFGPENMKPVFVAQHLLNTGYSKIVKDQHIRFGLRKDDIQFEGIGFNMADKFPLLLLNNPMDVVFTLDENEWNGKRNLQLKIIDFRLSKN